MTRSTSKLIQTALLTSGLFLLSACGGGGDGEGSIDVAAYLPDNDLIKHYEVIKNNGTNTTRQRLTETIIVDINAIDGHTVIDTEQRTEETDGTLIGTPRSQQDHIYDTNITSAEFNTDINRYVDIGDSVFGGPITGSTSITADDGTVVSITADCIYKSQHTDFPIADFDYGEDFLETECTFSSDPVIVDGVQRQFHITSSMYQKKGIGTVFSKSVWCEVAPQILSDLDMSNCDENKTIYSIQLLDPEDS